MRDNSSALAANVYGIFGRWCVNMKNDPNHNENGMLLVLLVRKKMNITLQIKSRINFILQRL